MPPADAVTDGNVLVRPYRPPHLNPLSARLHNALCCKGPWPLSVAGRNHFLCPCAHVLDFDPSFLLSVSIGQFPCQIALAGGDVVLLHPALDGAETSAAFPDELKYAVVELLARPLLDALSGLLEIPVILTDIFLGAQTSSNGEAEFASTLLVLEPDLGQDAAEQAGDDGESPDYAPRKHRTAPVFVRVSLPGSEAVRALAPLLELLPEGGLRRRQQDRFLSLPLYVALESGDMRLRLDELSALEPGDILLPENYFLLENRLRLQFYERRTGSPASWSALCSFDGTFASITDILNATSTMATDMEQNLTEPMDSPPVEEELQETSPSSALDPYALEVSVSFELERRMMTLEDILKLAPGYTFAVDASPSSPVTLRANGKAFGQGKLVDLNGVLGIQVVRINE